MDSLQRWLESSYQSDAEETELAYQQAENEWNDMDHFDHMELLLAFFGNRPMEVETAFDHALTKNNATSLISAMENCRLGWISWRVSQIIDKKDWR